MASMTVAKARKLGYIVQRGATLGTSDNRADRWYVERDNNIGVQRRGRGFATKANALARVEELSAALDHA